MSLPQIELQPDDPDRLPPARRRRARRLLAPMDANERTALLARLTERVFPSFDFFVLSLWSGAVISIGLLLDVPVIILLGAILAPFMAPVIGLALGTVTGSVRYFVISLVGLVIGSLLVIATGALAGYAARVWLPLDLQQAHLHAQVYWADFLVLAFGAVVTTATVSHPGRNAALPSVALAYELYTPLAAAGFGLGSGVEHLWPDGLVVFALHLTWAALLGALTLAILGYRPLTLFGYSLGAVAAMAGVILLIGFSSATAVIGAQIGLPTPIPTVTPSPTLTPTQTLTPVPPTSTSTPTVTITPSLTPTNTPTLTATPIPALVFARDGGGAILRDQPGGKPIGSIRNQHLVQVLPETQEANGITWVHVISPDGKDGWVQLPLVATFTPTPTP